MKLHPARGAFAFLVAVVLLSCGEIPTEPGSEVTSLRATVTAVTRTAPVISQVYGGGGNSGATYRNDFIEIFNPGPDAVSLAGWSVQYASAAGTTWAATALTGTIQPGGYYLVQQAAGTGGTVNLPTPNATGSIAMSGTGGKVILASQATALSGACPLGATVVDRLAYGVNACGVADVWLGNAPALTNTTAALRNDNGCAYTGNPATDFAAGAPAPRNSSSAVNICGGVEAEPASVTLAPPTPSIIIGATQAFTPTARDAADNVVSTTYTWSSSDVAVATVDANGIATAVATGTTIITATSANNIAGTATLTVNPVPPPPSSNVFISQIYGGGGNTGAPYTNDYIELFNRGDVPVDVTGWSVQYSSAAGTTWQVTALSGTLQPGRHYLVQEAAGAGTPAALPTPDASGTIPMAAGAGKIVLSNTAAAMTVPCPTGGSVVDRVGYGSNATANGCTIEWGARTSTLTNSTAALRKNDGCVNTGVAANDFQVLAPVPRNTSSPVKNCTQPARPASTALIVINELMGDPVNAESASWGEWFEVYNYGATPIDLQGWTIVSSGSSQPDHTVGSSVIVPAGGYAVLGRGADASRNGGVALDYNYFVGTASTIWLDDSDFLMLVDPLGALADSVAWTSLPRGITRGLRDAAAANADVDGANWGYSTTTFGDGDFGTPDAANPPLSDTAPYVSPNKIVFSGRTASDAPLPVGFEAQVFASLVDQSNVVQTTTITWSALTPALASVDTRGVIHALAAGEARFRATATDGTARTLALIMETPVASITAQYGNNIEFGAPTDDTPADEFIVSRPQYTSSFNGSRGIPNWVAYDLNSTHIVAGQDRCNCFTFDPELEDAGFTRYTTADYTNSGAFAGYGIDRGHMTRSFDRTSGTLDNARTYYFSNVVPQTADMNQGPWANMENYLGDLARLQNKEVYIYVGPAGTKGTLKDEGRITIPDYTWKVAVVMPRGKGLADVNDYRDLSVIAAVMPNLPGAAIRSANWETQYKVTVDSVEKLTGYRFLGLLPEKTQRILKLGIMPPIAQTDGPYAGVEGTPVAMSGATSVDPNGTIAGYTWSFGDGSTGSGATPSHTYALTGSYTVRLIVTDNDALADTTFTTVQVARIAPADGHRNLVAIVNELVADGKITSDTGSSLMSKLDAAGSQLTRGNLKTFMNQIKAFINQVNSLERDGILDAADAERLRFEATRLIAAVQ